MINCSGIIMYVMYLVFNILLLLIIDVMDILYGLVCVLKMYMYI